MAARAAAAVSAVLVAQVLPEAQLPVPARRPAAAAVVLRALPALRADRLLALAAPWLPRVPLLAAFLVLVVRAAASVEAVPVVELLLLLSRQSFSAAMARSTP